MQIGIPKESQDQETRVAASPEVVKKMMGLGFHVAVESGAGSKAQFTDASYADAGANIVDAESVWASDIVLKVNAPNDQEISSLKEGALLVSFIWPALNPELIKSLAERKIVALAMDAVPRISRAQSLDALSAMANIAGYRAVIEAAHEFERSFTGQITAAGKIPPSKVLVIGAGVAGLSAIGTAQCLGAIVRAFDTRPEVKEQVESMGAEFLELDFEEDASSSSGYAKVMSDAFIRAEMVLFSAQAKEVDIIITTALIPGKPAPRLISADMVRLMKPGSVVVDLAAANGGNCELSKADEIVTTDNGVRIIGYTDLPGRLPTQASQLYGTNLLHLLELLCKEKNGQIEVDFSDEVIRSMTVTHEGKVTWPPPPVKVSATPAKPEKTAPVATAKQEKKKPKPWLKPTVMGIGAALFGLVAHSAPPEFLSHFTVFVLACIIGYHIIWSVSHALHTPLMSVTNAISGIIVVGALLQVGKGSLITTLACIAIFIATINVVGGFTVTQRMLKMFRK